MTSATPPPGFEQVKITIENRGPDPADLLREAASMYESRAPVYGNSHRKLGEVLAILLPSGIELKTADDFSRFCTMALCIMKIVRYGINFEKGGHLDSARDLQVYAAILESKTDGA